MDTVLGGRSAAVDEGTRIAYQEICHSYRAIDDFRAKLLGFLPLATGGGLLTLVAIVDGEDRRYLSPLGLFGLVTVLGLFLFEIHGISKCHGLIEAGSELERRLGSGGQFTTRPRTAWGFVNEPIAAGVVYSVVMAAWAYVALLFAVPESVAWWPPVCLLIAGLTFAGGLTATVRYEHHLRRTGTPTGPAATPLPPEVVGGDAAGSG